MTGKRALVLVVLMMVLVSSAATGAPSPVHVRFGAAGDFAIEPGTPAVLRSMADSDLDAVFALGDLSYGTTPDEQGWCDFVTARVGAGFPFELLAGNHESNGQHGNINDFGACLPNQLPGLVGTYGRQYYVDVPQEQPLVRFVMVSPDLPFPDGVWSYAQGTARYQWTAAAVDGARAAGIPWVVVGMHKPCLSVGDYGCENRADLVNMLIAKRVDLVLSGHEHNYQRTKQLALSTGCPALALGSYDADCVADADNDLTAGAGTVFATIGTGGIVQRSINSTDPEMPYFAATSGSNDNQTWGFGAFDVTPEVLTASFVPATGGDFSDRFTLTKRAAEPNRPPTAAFVASTNGLTVEVDGSGSFDTDGAIASYSWDFGDQESGTGRTAQHTYAQAGTYPVALTVTDDDGATATVTRQVTVTAPSPQLVAADAFERTLTDTWGTADTGGAWTGGWPPQAFAVNSGSGVLRLLSAGGGPVTWLAGVSSPSSDLTVSLRLNKVPAGGTSGLDAGVVVRRVPNQGDYRMRVRFVPGGAVRVALVRVSATGSQTNLVAETVVTGLTYAAGDVLNVRVQAVGTSPTTLRGKLWRATASEPNTWTLSATDPTSGLQAPGTVGFHDYLAGSVTNAPIEVRYDDLRVVAGTQP